MILISCNTIQDYFDSKKVYNSICPKHYNFWNVNASQCLYYSTEYDSDYDIDEDYYEFVEAVQNDRIELFQVIMICVELMVCLISFIQIKHLKI